MYRSADSQSAEHFLLQSRCLIAAENNGYCPFYRSGHIGHQSHRHRKSTCKHKHKRRQNKRHKHNRIKNHRKSKNSDLTDIKEDGNPRDLTELTIMTLFRRYKECRNKTESCPASADKHKNIHKRLGVDLRRHFPRCDQRLIDRYSRFKQSLCHCIQSIRPMDSKKPEKHEKRKHTAGPLTGSLTNDEMPS